MEWISVKDRLPEDCVPVLVFCPLLSAMTVAYLSYDVDGKPISYFIVDFDEYDQTTRLDQITHWMPLPEPLDQMTKMDIHEEESISIYEIPCLTIGPSNQRNEDHR